MSAASSINEILVIVVSCSAKSNTRLTWSDAVSGQVGVRSGLVTVLPPGASGSLVVSSKYSNPAPLAPYSCCYFFPFIYQYRYVCQITTLDCKKSSMTVSEDVSKHSNMSDDLYLEDFDDTSIFENKAGLAEVL